MAKVAKSEKGDTDEVQETQDRSHPLVLVCCACHAWSLYTLPSDARLCIILYHVQDWSKQVDGSPPIWLIFSLKILS